LRSEIARISRKVNALHRFIAAMTGHYCLATNMIRHGASLAEIAEVLRHRSQTTTAIYTHVSFEALRTVAQPWPTTGGDR